MYFVHPNLASPPDDAVIWRYMDLAKFLALLERKALFFVRMTELRDPFEGHLTRTTVERLRATPAAHPENERERLPEIIEHNLGVASQSREIICVSCWHQNQVESAAMWELYMPSGQGIAIRTTFSRFKASFTSPKPDVVAGLVRYVDFESFEVDSSNIFNSGIIKRLSFEHEREFRAFVLDGSNLNAGVSVSVELDVLVESVLVSPAAPAWYAELIGEVATRYALKAAVSQSELLRHPIYVGSRREMGV
jgi:hypothetical protein